MYRNKKGASSAMVFVSVVAILLLVVATFGVYHIVKQDNTAIGTHTTKTTQTGTALNLGIDCPSDGTTDGRVRYQDALASTITYDASPTVYFIPLSAGVQRVTAGSLSASDYSAAVDLKCTSSGTKWQAIAVTTADDMHSAVGQEFIAEGSYVKVDLVGKAFDTLQFKVEDKYTGGSTFFNETACGAGSILTYRPMNGSLCIIKDKAGNTALKVDTDEEIDARIFVKTNSTKKQFGEDGLRTFMLVDADASAWDVPIVSRDGGSKLSNVLTSLKDDDRRRYSGYEYAYEIGSITDKESYIDFYLQTASGVDPGASVDPIIEFCSEGRYNSVKAQDTINIGCWTDAATQTQVSTALRQYFQFDVTA